MKVLIISIMWLWNLHYWNVPTWEISQEKKIDGGFATLTCIIILYTSIIKMLKYETIRKVSK